MTPMEKTLNEEIIKSISYDQQEILQNIIKLHTGDFELDTCYGSGCFYRSIKRPGLCFDLSPKKDEVIPADVRHLPLRDGCINSVIFDPPFMAKTAAGAVMKVRFGEITGTIADLILFYFQGMNEIHRVLKPGGYLVFKCQDGVLSGINNNNYGKICNMAEVIGFKWVDLFILLAKHRMMHPKHKVQKHARKYHSYFIVFRRK